MRSTTQENRRICDVLLKHQTLIVLLSLVYGYTSSPWYSSVAQGLLRPMKQQCFCLWGGSCKHPHPIASLFAAPCCPYLAALSVCVPQVMWRRVIPPPPRDGVSHWEVKGQRRKGKEKCPELEARWPRPRIFTLW